MPRARNLLISRLATLLILGLLMSLQTPVRADPTVTRAELVNSTHVALLPNIRTVYPEEIGPITWPLARWWTIVIAEENGGWRFLVERSFPNGPGENGIVTGVDPEIHLSQDA